MNYIYPPRSSTCLPKDQLRPLLDVGFRPELKYNDSHALFDFNVANGQATLVKVWNRHGGELKYDWTSLNSELERLAVNVATGDGRLLLDGGLLDSRHTAVKGMVVLWDVLVDGGKNLYGTTYEIRHRPYVALINDYNQRFLLNGYDLGPLASPHVIATEWMTDVEAAWKLINAVNDAYKHPFLEGLVMKNLKDKLKPGFSENNNSTLMVRSRVTTKRSRF